MTEETGEWLTVEQAAELLGVSTRTFRRRQQTHAITAKWGEAPKARVKPNRLYLRADVEKLVDREPSSDSNV